MDNDPKHVEAAYEAALEKKNKRLKARIDQLEFALQIIADNQHGFYRPAGKIAKAALEGEEIPDWENR